MICIQMRYTSLIVISKEGDNLSERLKLTIQNIKKSASPLLRRYNDACISLQRPDLARQYKDICNIGDSFWDLKVIASRALQQYQFRREDEYLDVSLDHISNE